MRRDILEMSVTLLNSAIKMAIVRTVSVLLRTEISVLNADLQLSAMSRCSVRTPCASLRSLSAPNAETLTSADGELGVSLTHRLSRRDA